MSNTDDEHDAEGTTIAFERAQVSALHDQAIHDAAALRRTLVSLDDDEFGVCEQCGGPIGFRTTCRASGDPSLCRMRSLTHEPRSCDRQLRSSPMAMTRASVLTPGHDEPTSWRCSPQYVIRSPVRRRHSLRRRRPSDRRHRLATNSRPEAATHSADPRRPPAATDSPPSHREHRRTLVIEGVAAARQQQGAAHDERRSANRSIATRLAIVGQLSVSSRCIHSESMRFPCFTAYSRKMPTSENSNRRWSATEASFGTAIPATMQCTCSCCTASIRAS